MLDSSGCITCSFPKVNGFVFAFQIVDPKTGDEKSITVSVDDGIRPNTTLSGLAKLRPVFKEDGTTTAGTFPKFIGHFQRKMFVSSIFFFKSLVSFVSNRKF